MSVSPRTINENEYGAAFELQLSDAKMGKEVIAEKLTVTTPRAPLTDRLQKADTKRKSLIDEKVVKARANVEKAKHLSKMKVTEESTKVSETREKMLETQAKVEEARKAKIQEKLEKCKVKEVVKPVKANETAIENKMSKVEENRKRQIQEKLEKCKVKTVKTKKELEDEKIQEVEVKLVKKLSNAQLNKDTLQEQELARLREKHEKVEMVKVEKKKKKSMSPTAENPKLSPTEKISPTADTSKPVMKKADESRKSE